MVSGPHYEFSKVEKSFNGMHASKYAFICNPFYETTEKVRILSKMNDEMPLLGLEIHFE